MWKKERRGKNAEKLHLYFVKSRKEFLYFPIIFHAISCVYTLAHTLKWISEFIESKNEINSRDFFLYKNLRQFNLKEKYVGVKNEGNIHTHKSNQSNRVVFIVNQKQTLTIRYDVLAI